MNYIKEAENYLYYYRDLKVSLDNMQLERDKLIQENGPKDITSIELDITGVGGGCKHDDAINALYKIQQLTKAIKETEQKLTQVDEILSKLDKIEETVLRMWYIDREQKDDIAELLSYTTRHLYRVKDAAIRKFAIQILGINALAAI